MPESSSPCVLVVADPERIAELTDALREPLPQGEVELVTSTGGDDTIELFDTKRPRVVLLTASLEIGDAKSLIEVLREMVPRDQVVMVLIGDDEGGVVRTAMDAIDMKPDRFVARPLTAKAVRFAVGSGLDTVARAMGELAPATSDGSGSLRVHVLEEAEASLASADAADDGAADDGAADGGAADGGVADSGVTGGDDPILPSSEPSAGSASEGAGAGTDMRDPANGSATGAAARFAEVVPLGSRTTTPLRGSGTGTIPIPFADESPFLRVGTAPRFGSLVETGEVPTVMPRSSTRAVSPTPSNGDAAGPAIARAPTNRGTGILPLFDDAGGDAERVGDDVGEGVDGDVGEDVDDDVRGDVDDVEPRREHEPDARARATQTPHLLPRASTEKGTGIAMVLPATPDNLALDQQARRAALRKRWEALADSIGEDVHADSDADDDDEVTREVDVIGEGDVTGEVEPASDSEPGAVHHAAGDDEIGLDDVTEDRPAPLPLVEVPVRAKPSTNPDFMPVPPLEPWRPGTSSGLREEPEVDVPPREPTLILRDDGLVRSTPPPDAAPAVPAAMSTRPSQATQTTHAGAGHPAESMGATDAGTRGDDTVTREHEREPRERWSHPVLLSELIDRSRDSSRELLAHVAGEDDLAGLEALEDHAAHLAHTPVPHVVHGSQLEPVVDAVGLERTERAEWVGGPLYGDPAAPAAAASEPSVASEPPSRPSEDRIGGRDFARQLRAKMSMMAQRLFQSDSAEAPPSVDLRPRHDHHTEIDLASLGEEPPLVAVTEIERQAIADPVQMATSPGTWDTQVRERGLPDAGEIVRGVSDVAMILARMFALSYTGRVGFRKDDVEKVVFFDGGRPVFASSNEPGDRMGELLVREGKITASQYERCQVVVAQSGRRMGEILVDFGYLKRRELLPAVRRHVEDIVYSLFGWDRGHYHVMPDTHASAERIRLSRHPASLVLEGIRRKLDRTTLEKVLGPPSTVIEVADRERLGGILNAGDLAQEERAALTAFDGQADLAQVASATGVDIADVLPLAWGLCALGLATARRAEIEHEESTALVGETDLAIDRERVRARWQLVTEADYFALLGVRRDATGFEIRRAYQAARRDFAPDVFPSDLRRELARELEDIASVLDEAFRVLRDDQLRQTYLVNLIE